MMKAMLCGLAVAAMFAAGAAETGTGLAFSGYLTKISAGGTPIAVSVSTEVQSGEGIVLRTVGDCEMWMETNGYVAVTVPCEVPAEATAVKWTFSAKGVRETVTQSLTCAPYAIVAERADRIVPPDGSLTVPGSLRATSADAFRTFSVGTWGAPNAEVLLGGEDVSTFAFANVAPRLDVDRASTNCPARVALLGAPDTNNAVRAEIRGGKVASDVATFTASSDGLLEVTLKGVVSYSHNSAYGDYPDQDGLCHVCAMVGTRLTDADGQPLLSEVFGDFRPWIVPTSELTDKDGRMTSRLTVPMRRGDTFRVWLQFANFVVSGDRSHAGRPFVPITVASWVDGGSWATAELAYRAFGGEK